VGAIPAARLKAHASEYSVMRKRREVLAGLLIGAIAVVLWGTCRGSFTHTWSLPSARGGAGCDVQQATARKDVIDHCGTPTRAGGQPKVVSRTLDAMCSAPCDTYGDRLVYYDCDVRVAKVVKLVPETYQGCVFL
jgi:hypothetical protein